MFGLFEKTVATNNIDKAREALKYFHNQNSKYDGYNITLDELIKMLASNEGRYSGDAKFQAIFLDGFGSAIANIESGGFLNTSKIQVAMENLADRSQGQIPKQAFFFSALSEEAQNLTFIDTARAVTVGTAEDLVKGAQAVGNAVIDTGKSLTMILPIVIVGAVLFIVVSKARKIA